MDSFAGGIINKFKIKRRRVTLFFEDILAEYIKECEDAGYQKEMREIGELWGMLSAEILIPASIKNLPPHLLGAVAKKIWTNTGILKDVRLMKTGNVLLVSTEEEAVTRIIGENNLLPGYYMGILKAYMNREIVPIKISQNGESCKYAYKITDHDIVGGIRGKSSEAYNRLNVLPPIRGFTLNDALKKNVLQLSENRIYFRKKSILNWENTVFHIIGNRKILLEKVPEISYRYFNDIVDRNASIEKKSLLLKTLLQVMGWGTVGIMVRDNNILSIKLSHLPHGLQMESDNWDFLIKTILGYLWTIDRRFQIGEITPGKRHLIIEYTAITSGETKAV